MWQGVLHAALLPSADAPRNESMQTFRMSLCQPCDALLCRVESGNQVRWRVQKLFTGSALRVAVA